MEPLPGEVGTPTDYTFEKTTLQGGFFVSGAYVTRAADEDQHWIR
jgi:hypothetical protein